MTTLHDTTESDAKWQAWLARGRAQDLRTNRIATVVGIGLAIASAVAVAAALLAR